MVSGRFRDMRPSIYSSFRKNNIWVKSSNKLLIIYWTLSIPKNCYQNTWIRYDISLAIKKIEMKVTYEYLMTSSDQILWIFLRLNDPIHSVKPILIMLTYILLPQLLLHCVHPLTATGGWASNQIFNDEGLDRIPVLRGGIAGKGMLQFLHKK